MIQKRTKGQSKKSKIFSLHPNNRAQEEMVGFSLIIIIIAVILLIFLSFSLKKDNTEEVSNYEVEGFIQSVLHYTTECNDGSEYLSIQKLISECNSANQKCENGEFACTVLEETIKPMLEESWKIGEKWPNKGYEFKIESESKGILLIQEGDLTGNSKGGVQDFAVRGEGIYVLFTVYS